MKITIEWSYPLRDQRINTYMSFPKFNADNLAELIKELNLEFINNEIMSNRAR